MAEISQIITQLICTVGFPIAAYLLQFWDKRETMKQLETTIANNTEAVSNFSNEISRLKDSIDRLDNQSKGGE